MQQAKQTSGIPLDELVGVGAPRERPRSRTSMQRAAMAQARFERLQAELDASNEERAFLRDEVTRLHERAEKLERHLQQVTMLLRHEQIRRAERDELEEVETMDDPDTELRTVELPAANATVSVVNEPMSVPKRIGRWFAMLFRDEEDDLLR